MLWLINHKCCVSVVVQLATLLLTSNWVNGASLPVDAKKSASSESSEPAAETSSSADASSSNDDSQDARIGLYAQKQYDGYSFGPIGGNSAFYLTSLPGYDGKFFQWPNHILAQSCKLSFVLFMPPSN